MAGRLARAHLWAPNRLKGSDMCLYMRIYIYIYILCTCVFMSTHVHCFPMKRRRTRSSRAATTTPADSGRWGSRCCSSVWNRVQRSHVQLYTYLHLYLFYLYLHLDLYLYGLEPTAETVQLVGVSFNGCNAGPCIMVQIIVRVPIRLLS